MSITKVNWLKTMKKKVDNGRLLVLVLASDTSDVYISLQVQWRALMAANIQSHITILFLKSRDGLSEVMRQGDTLWVPGKETLIPGVLVKTIEGFKWGVDKGFNYIFRTNISSFLVVSGLYAWVTSQAIKRTYCGIVGWVGPTQSFVSGSGILLSKDVAAIVARMPNPLDSRIIDDVAIGIFLKLYGISASTCGARRRDLIKTPKIPLVLNERDFHYRLKQVCGDRSKEPDMFAELLERTANIL